MRRDVLRREERDDQQHDDRMNRIAKRGVTQERIIELRVWTPRKEMVVGVWTRGTFTRWPSWFRRPWVRGAISRCTYGGELLFGRSS